ncbi:MAG: DUF6157 family protein [Bacteroidia bacterium]
MKTTNYHNTFIKVAEDCPVTAAEVPPQKSDKKTIANLQFEMINDAPYQYTSDDVIFEIHAKRKGVSKAALASARQEFFSCGQACLRTSPLARRYGWGIHSDASGKVALYPLGSAEYNRFANDETLKQVMAMRSTRG